MSSKPLSLWIFLRFIIFTNKHLFTRLLRKLWKTSTKNMDIHHEDLWLKSSHLIIIILCSEKMIIKCEKTWWSVALVWWKWTKLKQIAEWKTNRTQIVKHWIISTRNMNLPLTSSKRASSELLVVDNCSSATNPNRINAAGKKLYSVLYLYIHTYCMYLSSYIYIYTFIHTQHTYICMCM